jgi:small ligand-binding sensory domain FIST
MSDRHSPAALRAAYSRGHDWFRATQACIDQLHPLPAHANLGFVYLGRALGPFADMVLSHLQRATGIRSWVGATGRTALGSGAGHERDGGLATLVAALPERGFRLLDLNVSRADGELAGAAILHAEAGAAGTVATLAGFAARSPAFLLGVVSEAGSSLPQIAGSVAEGTVSGVLLAHDFALVPLTARTCAQLGPPCRVTSRVGDEIFRLNGRPALEVLFDRLGDIARARPARAVDEVLVGRVPVGDEPSRPTTRVAAFNTARGSLVLEPSSDFAGADITLFRRDPRTAERELREGLASVMRRLGGRRPAGVFYFTAAQRLARLEAAGLDEVELVQQTLGRPPLVGLASDAVIVEGVIEPYAAAALVLA